MDGPISIRSATADDLRGIRACDPGGADDRREFLAGAVTARWCLVATSGAEIVGFVVTTPGHFFGRDFVELLVVAAPRRRGGVGRALLRAAVRRANGDDAWTSTNRSNGPMQGLLTAEGWEFCGEVTGLDADDPELFFRIATADRDAD